MQQRDDVLYKLDQAIARAGGAKVMLRLDEALAIRAVLSGQPAPACALRDEGLPCACSFLDPKCPNRRAA